MSRMEMIYIDANHQALKTGVGAIMDTPLLTWADFNARRAMAVPFEDAEFILDYYNRNGDLAASIPLSAEGYKAITGQPVLSEDEYRQIDHDFWARVRDELRSSQGTAVT